jgi:nucleotide-binding universal stress UspA family protein
MARKLRWVGITCEPILNKAFHAVEIPGLAKSRDVERVIITSQDGQSAMNSGWRIFIDQLLRGSEVPVCIIGGLAFPDPVGERRAGRVSLALSLSSDSETALGFACRFAQERHSRLTLLHVFNKEDGIAEARSILEVTSHLPALTLREAELFCPLEIAVREGDPASEILKFDANTNQDFIILRSAGLPQSAPPDSASVSQRIIREARCPVIILGQTAVHEFERSAVGPKSPQSVWEPEAQLRRAGD